MEQNLTPDPQQPVFAPPAPPRLSDAETLESSHTRRRIGTGIAVAAVAIGALGLGGIAYAANGSGTTPSPSTGSGAGQNTPRYGAQGNTAPQGPGGMRHGDGMRPGMAGGFGGGLEMGLRGAIHGSVVTPKQGGGYQTIDGQRGAVTAVSATSISVKSDDGFTATYVVTKDTVVNATRDGIASVKVGDKVGVMGIESAGSTTAVRIIDETVLKASGQKWMPQGPGTHAPNGGPGGASGSASSSGTA